MNRLTFTADGAITQGAAVKLTGSMKVAISTASTDITIGVALSSADDTKDVLVELCGAYHNVWAGGVITAGDAVVPTTAGDFIKTTAVDYQFVALNGAAASGDMFTVVEFHVISGVNDIVQMATVTVSSAEILALYTTAKEIVAAPTSGKALIFEKAVIMYDYLTTAYTIGSATNLAFNYTDKTGAAVSATQAVTGMIDQVTDQYRFVPALATALTPVAAAKLVLSLAGANPTAGVGTLKVTIFYRVVTL